MDNKKSKVAFVMKLDQFSDNLIFKLLDTHQGYILRCLLRHFSDNIYFTSNEITMTAIIQKKGIDPAVYRRALSSLTKKEILIKVQRGYYMLNYKYLQPIESYEEKKEVKSKTVK